MESRDVVGGVDFSGESFVVASALFGTTYSVETAAGETLLEARRTYSGEPLRYVYADDSGAERFRFEGAGGDERGAFEFFDAESEERLATLERADEGWYRWRLNAEPDERVAIVGEEGRVPLLDSQRGRHMTMRAPDGETVGSVDRRILAVRFIFDVELPGLAGVAKAAALLAVPLLYDAMRELPSAWR
ncbi:MAG: hypothetical protein ABEJ40_02960 [Haloarculaceae archaeon]